MDRDARASVKELFFSSKDSSRGYWLAVHTVLQIKISKEAFADKKRDTADANWIFQNRTE